MIVPHDGNGRYDPTVTRIVEKVNSKYPIVPVTRWAEYKFNEQLLSLKDYVLLDYCEMDWDFSFEQRGQHLFGVNTDDFQDKFPGEEWYKFDRFVKENPPKLYMKRELLRDRHIGKSVVAVDYPAYTPPVPIQSREQFESRPLDVMYYFGRSHEDRLRLHANIWLGASKYGYNVCDNSYYYNGFMQHEQGKKWVSFNIPHYARMDIKGLLEVNGMAKIGIAPHGAGIKTFRHSEVSSNAVMLTWEDKLEWSSEWIDAYNCIKCDPGEEIETMQMWLSRPDYLYDVYKRGVENWNFYHIDNYSKYLEGLINNA